MCVRIRCHSRDKSSLSWHNASKGGYFMVQNRDQQENGAGRGGRPLFDAKTLAEMGALVAAEVVLARFLSINAWNIRIGFSFVPVAIAGMVFGPVPAGIVAAVADVLGAALFPTGPFFPGFTLTAFLTGAVLGGFLHRARTPWRILGAVLVNQGLCSLLLNSLWISVLYHSPLAALLGTRAIQAAVTAPVQFVVIGALARSLKGRIGEAAA